MELSLFFNNISECVPIGSMSKTMELNNSTRYDIDSRLNGQERYDEYRHQRFSFDDNWYVRYNEYMNFLSKYGNYLTQKTNKNLYHWYLQQKNLLKNRTLSTSRVSAFCSLIEKVDAIKQRQKERKDEKRLEAKEAEIKKREDSLKNKSLSLPSEFANDKQTVESLETETKGKRLGNDDLWNSKWQAYVDYMNEHGCRPSKHHKEDMVLFDWFKHSKRLLKRGLMKAERITKFKQLLSEAENLPRFNQFNYVDTSLKS